MQTVSYQELIERDVRQVFPCSEETIIELLRASYPDLLHQEDATIKAAFAKWFAEIVYAISEEPGEFINRFNASKFWKHIPEIEVPEIEFEQQKAA